MLQTPSLYNNAAQITGFQSRDGVHFVTDSLGGLSQAGKVSRTFKTVSQAHKDLRLPQSMLKMADEQKQIGKLNLQPAYSFGEADVTNTASDLI